MPLDLLLPIDGEVSDVRVGIITSSARHTKYVSESSG